MIRPLATALSLLVVTLPSDVEARRSSTARCQFLASQGFPNCRTPPGMIVDHVIPLACGGPDHPSNMQLQTKAHAAAKDKWERNGCRH